MLVLPDIRPLARRDIQLVLKERFLLLEGQFKNR
jgi:hypothetical protein